jgi:hypothetical protein
MRNWPTSVVPVIARDLTFSAAYEEKDFPLRLEITIAAESPKTEEI